MLKKRIGELEALNTKLSRIINEDESFINTTPDIFYTIDFTGKLQRWNSRLQELCGLSPDVMKERPCIDFVCENDRPVVMEDVQKVFENGFHSNVYRFIKGDGSLVPFHCIGSVIKDDNGQITGFMGTGREISEMIRKEEELRKAKEAAESATKLKDRFITLLSHDLRSPISNLLLGLRIIDGGQASASDSADIMQRGIFICESMLSMINQLLNVSKLKSGAVKLNRKYHNMRALGERVVKSVLMEADAKGIAVVNDLPENMKLFIDGDLFAEVIRNLVGNSIKFCGKGCFIKIYSPDGGSRIIAVKDKGIGMTEATISLIMGEGETASSNGTAGEKGTGLGLSFCKDIVEAHGGALKIESAQNEGSTVIVEFPETRALVMLVDDQEIARESYKDILKSLKVEFMEASNGYEALRMIMETTPNLIITDCRMPEMDGFEFLQSLKNSEKTANIPVIVATSSVGMEDSHKALNLGANDFITKPVAPNELVPRVSRFLGF
ncbi:MAG: response regulator [Nitrospinae bacterium]|nr:response regulator [Nitrospinota bacterium]